jgi:hypothetical protein
MKAFTPAFDGGPAFPEAVSADALGGLNFSRQSGLTIRDYFAAHALMGILAAESSDKEPLTYTESAEEAYLQADAMLKVRHRLVEVDVNPLDDEAAS